MSRLTLGQQKVKSKITGETILGERVKEMMLTCLKVSYTHMINKNFSIHSYCTAVTAKDTQQWRIRPSSSGWFNWCRNQYNRLRGGSHIPGLPAVRAVPSTRLAAVAGAQRCRSASVSTLDYSIYTTLVLMSFCKAPNDLTSLTLFSLHR